MALKLKDGSYKCSVCGKVFFPHNNPHGIGTPMMRAAQCEVSHDVVYVPLTRPEITSLIQFIFTKDESLITEELYLKLLRFNNKDGFNGSS